MYYVYILRSLKDKKNYIGQTSDINNRFTEHINGLIQATKSRLPLECIYIEMYNTRKEAMQRERHFKTYNGWRELKNILTSGDP